MAWLARPDPQYESYQSELCRTRLIPSLKNAVVFVIGLNTLFAPLDVWTQPEDLGSLLALRAVWNVLLATLYFARERFHPVRVTQLACVITGLALIGLIGTAGGLTGSYWPGIMLLFLGMPVLLPLSATQAAGVVAFLLLVFASLPAVGGETIALASYLAPVFFVAGAALECIASCALLDRMRFADFGRRQEVEKARDQLAQLDREKSRFTANVHHELRTPLTLMLAPLDAMLEGEFGAVSDLQRQYLKTMHSNARRLLKLINNLLDLARIEGNQLRVTRVPTRVGDLLGELLASARPLAERKGVALEARGLEALPEVHVDSEALEKVVVNLVGNALKFTDRGGRIELSGEAAADGGIRLVVADTGTGIPPDQIERIFDRFAQVDGSGTRRHEGTGIGLSLVKELVELHGGRVWATSEGLGRGTQMHVTLPAGEADADREEDVLEGAAGNLVSLGNSIAAMEGELDLEGAPPRPGDRLVQIEHTVERAEFDASAASEAPVSPAPGPDAAEVLVVEDNADMRRLLAFLIGQEFQVRTARNGREALERVAEKLPELVLTDVMMPEMSGTELCRALKQADATRNVPVVLVTSKAEREMKVRGLELGADDYVTKPFHPRELLARVRSLVRLRRLQEELSERNAALEAANAELGQALAELREAHVQLVQAERLAAVGELAAGVAHEVNNPVNFATNALKALRGYVEEVRGITARLAGIDLGDPGRREAQIAELEKLRDEIELDQVADALAELVAIVTEGLERTHRLVGDLRDFAAPGDGPRCEVDLRRSLESTLQLMGHELRRVGARVELDVTDPRPLVRGDARALNQVFLNLLKNAAEALEGRRGTIGVRIRRSGGRIAVEVRDDGPGIDPELHKRLFEPFFTTKPAGKGTGLGLSISRRIVTEHGGTIDVDSSPGRGTCFRVVLPAQGDGGAP
jgi:signal transduction histidine kinase